MPKNIHAQALGRLGGLAARKNSDAQAKGGRAAWAKLTPEQKAARIAKMVAGRKRHV